MVKYSEKRGDIRIIHKSPIIVENSKAEFIYRARMVNYSKNGLYLETDATFDQGAEIYIGIENSPFTNSLDNAPDCYRVRIIWQKDLPDLFYNHGYGIKIIASYDKQNLQGRYFQGRQELRKHPRRSYFKPVFFTSQNQYYSGRIRNISSGGVFIETAGTFTAGQIIKLVSPGTKFDRGVMLKGEVVYFSQNGVGVKLIGILKNGKQFKITIKT
jgi:Tfp pilus assembly protein PilZ